MSASTLRPGVTRLLDALSMHAKTDIKILVWLLLIEWATTSLADPREEDREKTRQEDDDKDEEDWNDGICKKCKVREREDA